MFLIKQRDKLTFIQSSLPGKMVGLSLQIRCKICRNTLKKVQMLDSHRTNLHEKQLRMIPLVD